MTRYLILFQLLKSFQKEASAYKIFDHERIVKFYGVKENGIHFDIHLEYIPGVNIESGVYIVICVFLKYILKYSGFFGRFDTQQTHERKRC